MRKFLTIAVPLFIILLMVGVVILLNALKPVPEKKEAEERPTSVFIARAERMTVVPRVISQGEVRPRREIDLVPQVIGRIVYINPNFERGGSFNEGEVLIRLEEADYKLAVIRARSRVAEARQELLREDAEAQMARRDWEELGEGEASALALREPQLEMRRAMLEAAQADLDEAELNLKRASLVAPFTGRVREKRADIGQVVSTATVLGRIFSTSIVQINLQLTDRELGMLGLPIGFEAEDRSGPVVHLNGVVAGEMHSWTGHVIRTDSAIDPQSRVLNVICEVDEPYGAGSDNGIPLAVGLFVTAELPGEPLPDVIVVPRQALRSDNVVYVAKPDEEGIDRLDIRRVDVAFSEPNRVVITDGLEAGEAVVISAVEGASRGLKLQLLETASGSTGSDPDDAPSEETTASAQGGD